MANIENKDHKKEVKKRFVKALYSYVPVNTDELSLKVHDILEVIEETEEGWWKGILEGNVGMFPSNFVIELDGHPEEFNNKLMNELSPTKNIIKGKNVGQQEPMHRHGKIAGNSLQANKENSKQPIMNSSSNNEVDGTTSSKCPPELSSEKKIITPSKKPSIDSSAPRLPPKPVREQARALFPYDAQNEDELTLKEGDIITVISKEVEDKGWWKGELNNKVGVFPDNFVKVIKAEEQKKPERPDKPSTVISSKVNLRTVSERNNSESSPKVDKKVVKTPPAKPPPPELHKKDPERPLPPCPGKKPQPPHPVKKPARISVGGKLPGFSTPPPPAPPVLKSPISETSPPPPTYPSASSEKVEESKKPVESVTEKKEKDSKKAEPEFDAVESSGKKLVHLTANRAKVPNRRPPSFIFLKENEKDVSVATDSRRRSEPLLAEMESLFPSTNKETVKASAISSLEKKPKVPPPRPFLPPSVKTSSTIKSSIGMTKGSSSLEETTTKTVEVEKKNLTTKTVEVEKKNLTTKTVEVEKKNLTTKTVEVEKKNLTAKTEVEKKNLTTKTEVEKKNLTTKTVEAEKKDLLSDIIPADITSVLKSEITPQKILEVCSDPVIKTVNSEVESHSSKEDPCALVTKKDFNELLKQVKELQEMLETYKNNSNKAISDLKVELEEEKRLRRTVEKELQKLRESQTT